MKKNSFRNNLQNYINGGCLSASDRLLYLFSTRMVFRKNGFIIGTDFKESKKNKSRSIESFTIKTNVYSGKNEFAIRLSRYLHENLRPYLAGAYVHGSIGTNEEIPYSDFDALVILKDEVLNDPENLSVAARLLNNARSILFDMDPLQHHGWFVMTESDLQNYPENYFPSVLFDHAKSFFADRGLELKLSVDPLANDFHSPFKNLCNSIETKLIHHRPANLYTLKNLLSEFMLLPSFYVQARDKKGIFKKFSFEEAKKDFTESDWRIMDEVSMLRTAWETDIPVWKRKLIASPRYFSVKLAKYISPAVPRNMKEKLHNGFFNTMLDFTKKISSKIA